MPFLIFSDGCAASIVSSQINGMELLAFNSTYIPDTENLITWRIGNQGFDMNLSGRVPATIVSNLPLLLNQFLLGITRNDISHWAIHPGGKAILDAVRDAMQIDEKLLFHSREVLRKFGNMSSATIMFVLKNILDKESRGQGCAIAFGPGLSIETMRFAI